MDILRQITDFYFFQKCFEDQLHQHLDNLIQDSSVQNSKFLEEIKRESSESLFLSENYFKEFIENDVYSKLHEKVVTLQLLLIMCINQC